MITVIHGEDITNSRNFLHGIKSKTENPVILDGNKMQTQELAQALEGGELFSKEKNIFIDDFLSKRKGKDAEAIADYINNHHKTANMYFWEGKDLTTKQINTFKDAKTLQYKLPQVLFAFLDSVTPKSPNAIKLFHQALETNEPELLFFMLCKQVRMLLALRESSSSQIDEVTRMSPWQRTKLQRQSQLFSANQLKNMLSKLGEIDVNTKTGNTALNLTQAIDIFLTDL